MTCPTCDRMKEAAAKVCDDFALDCLAMGRENSEARRVGLMLAKAILNLSCQCPPVEGGEIVKRLEHLADMHTRYGVGHLTKEQAVTAHNTVTYLRQAAAEIERLRAQHQPVEGGLTRDQIERHRDSRCRCSPETGHVPCESCAIHDLALRALSRGGMKEPAPEQWQEFYERVWDTDENNPTLQMPMEELRRIGRAMLLAAAPRGGADGWPTLDMCKAGAKVLAGDAANAGRDWGTAKQVFLAMLAAAPSGGEEGK